MKINKLNNNDEKELNQIDTDITTSILNTEKIILTKHHNHQDYNWLVLALDLLTY